MMILKTNLFLYYNFFKMQCPTCLRQLPKRYWRPSQWILETVVTPEFSQCKICDGEMQVPYWMSSSGSTCHSSAAPAPARAPTVRPMPGSCPDHVPKEALDLIELLIHFRSDMCSNFVYKWMELPRRVRKEYSYNGAIKCRWGFDDPKHYLCPNEKQS